MQHTVILKHLSEITGSPLRVFTLSPDGLWKESICYAKNDVPALPSQLVQWLREDISMPSLAVESGTRYYAIIPLGSVRYFFMKMVVHVIFRLFHQRMVLDLPGIAAVLPEKVHQGRKIILCALHQTL